MRLGFYRRLAWTGIRQNKKMYLPYILACIGVVMVSVVLPVIYKYGTEKARLTMMAVFVLFVLVFGLLFGALDVEEGADILMVKPALSYLDVIREVSDTFDLPLCAYQVSGEYAMIKAAGAAGLVDEYRLLCESALSIYRAGANILITYFAKELAEAMRKGDMG